MARTTEISEAPLRAQRMCAISAHWRQPTFSYQVGDQPQEHVQAAAGGIQRPVQGFARTGRIHPRRKRVLDFPWSWRTFKSCCNPHDGWADTRRTVGRWPFNMKSTVAHLRRAEGQENALQRRGLAVPSFFGGLASRCSTRCPKAKHRGVVSSALKTGAPCALGSLHLLPSKCIIRMGVR